MLEYKSTGLARQARLGRTELLRQLARHGAQLPEGGAWLVSRAESLFLAAMKHAWDEEHGGLVYGFAPDGGVCDGDKYFWVQAESLAAAALLAVRTAKAEYWDWYDRLWAYSWQHLVDHQHGAWYRILSRDNRKLSDQKSPAGKTDYHTMGRVTMCWRCYYSQIFYEIPVLYQWPFLVYALQSC